MLGTLSVLILSLGPRVGADADPFAEIAIDAAVHLQETPVWLRGYAAWGVITWGDGIADELSLGGGFEVRRCTRHGLCGAAGFDAGVRLSEWSYVDNVKHSEKTPAVVAAPMLAGEVPLGGRTALRATVQARLVSARLDGFHDWVTEYGADASLSVLVRW